VEIPTKYATSFWDEGRDMWISKEDTYTVVVSDSSAINEGSDSYIHNREDGLRIIVCRQRSNIIWPLCMIFDGLEQCSLNWLPHSCNIMSEIEY